MFWPDKFKGVRHHKFWTWFFTITYDKWQSLLEYLRTAFRRKGRNSSRNTT